MNGPAVVPTNTAFRAVLWKELVEGLKWGAISLLVSSVLIWVAVESRESVMSNIVPGLQNGPFMFATILSGLLIGFGQSIPENRGDRWGFLTHRPVSRTTLWLGKVIAGILIYLAAAGLPFALAMVWLATPGHRPMPFDIRMAEPGVADLLCGLVYYFAAMLSGMRNARWYASRTMAVGAALICTVTVTFVPDFWRAIVVVVVGMLVVGSAAWGTFVTGGEYGPQRRLTRIALGVSLFPGLAVVGSLIFAIGGMVFAFREGSGTDITNVQYELAGDGTIVKVTSVFHVFQPSAGPEITAVTDLQGRPVERYTTDSSRRLLTDGVIGSSPVPLDTLSRNFRPPGYRDIQRLIVRLVPPDDYRTPIAWYYVRDLRQIAAYDGISARLIGWLGPDGFSVNASAAGHFANPLRSTPYDLFTRSLLAFPDAVFRPELKQKKVVKVFSASPGETVLGTATTSMSGGFGGGSMAAVGITLERHLVSARDTLAAKDTAFNVIVTTRGVYVQGIDGTPQLSATNDARAAGYGSVVVMRATRAPGKPSFLWYHPETDGVPESRWRSMPALVAEYHAPASDAVARFTLPRIQNEFAVHTTTAATILTGLATPIVVPIFSTISARVKGHVEPRTRQSLIASGIALAAAVFFAAAAFFIGRRYAFSGQRLALWTPVAFLGGLLGVALMLSILEWPAREPCPSCGRKRVVDRKHCEHCGAAFVPPPLDGTEVFEPASP
jgi:hypothetical protein